MKESRVTPEMQAEVDDLLGAKTGASPRLAAARARQGGWLRIESARQMQEEVYGYDFRTMRTNTRALCDYLTHMALAAFSELAEVLYEFEWKRWTTDQAWVDRDRVIEELIDMDMFSDNMKAALGCSDEEYHRRYTGTQARNRKRMAEGYTQKESRR